jgi:transposase
MDFLHLASAEELNIADANWRVAKPWMQTVMDAIALAKALQMPILNMHMSTGAYFTMPAQRIYLLSRIKKRI